MQSKAELLSLQQIRCFCATLELGSFTAAAEALRVSQPAARSPSTPPAACATHMRELADQLDRSR